MSKPTLSFGEAETIGKEHKIKTPFILGIRGFASPGENSRKIYDDCIAVVSEHLFETFWANTDPSKFSQGIATLRAPQVCRYKFGTHNISKPKEKQYTALVQASEVHVLRDGENGEFKGYFGINIHRGGINTPGSAGCQTIPPEQWDEFKAAVREVFENYDLGTINYLIVEW